MTIDDEAFLTVYRTQDLDEDDWEVRNKEFNLMCYCNGPIEEVIKNVEEAFTSSF